MLTQVFATQAADKMDMEYTMSVVLSGFVLVFVALVLLIALVYLLGVIMRKNVRKSNPKNDGTSTLKKKDSNLSAQIEDGISDEVIAVIAAAIAAASDSSEGAVYSRIRSIKQIKPQRPVWASAGVYENIKPF